MSKNKLLLIILLIIVIIILCGCDNRKCTKSHREKTTCIRVVGFIYNGKVVIPITSPYECEKEVCDEYYVEGSDSNE